MAKAADFWSAKAKAWIDACEAEERAIQRERARPPDAVISDVAAVAAIREARERRAKPGVIEPGVPREIVERTGATGARFLDPHEVDLIALLPGPFAAAGIGYIAASGALLDDVRREIVRAYGSLDPVTSYDDPRIPLARPPEHYVVEVIGDPAAPDFLSHETRVALGMLGLTSDSDLAQVRQMLLLAGTNEAARFALRAMGATDNDVARALYSYRASGGAPPAWGHRFGDAGVEALEALVNEESLEQLSLLRTPVFVLPHRMWPPPQDIPVFDTLDGRAACLRLVIPMRDFTSERGLYLISTAFGVLMGTTADPRGPAPLKHPRDASGHVLEYMLHLDVQGVGLLVARWRTHQDARARGLEIVNLGEQSADERALANQLNAMDLRDMMGFGRTRHPDGTWQYTDDHHRANWLGVSVEEAARARETEDAVRASQLEAFGQKDMEF